MKFLGKLVTDFKIHTENLILLSQTSIESFISLLELTHLGLHG